MNKVKSERKMSFSPVRRPSLTNENLFTSSLFSIKFINTNQSFDMKNRILT